MEIERAIYIMEQAHHDCGLLAPDENFTMIDEEELNVRKKILNDFMNRLSPLQQEIFALKLTQGVPVGRRESALDLLLFEDSPIRTIEE